MPSRQQLLNEVNQCANDFMYYFKKDIQKAINEDIITVEDILVEFRNVINLQEHKTTELKHIAHWEVVNGSVGVVLVNDIQIRQMLDNGGLPYSIEGVLALYKTGHAKPLRYVEPEEML